MRRANSLRTRRAGADVGVSQAQTRLGMWLLANPSRAPARKVPGLGAFGPYWLKPAHVTCGHVWPLAQILSEAKARAVGVARAGPEGFT